jgi:hypothetical protein
MWMTSTALPVELYPELPFDEWPRFEEDRLGISIAHPPEMKANAIGYAITLGISAEALNQGIVLPLFVEVDVHAADTTRLPPIDNRADPVSVVEGLAADLEGRVTDLSVVDPPGARTFGDYQGAEAVVNTRQEVSQGSNAVTYYLAAIVEGERIVVMYATSPTSRADDYLPLAPAILDTVELR